MAWAEECVSIPSGAVVEGTRKYEIDVAIDLAANALLGRPTPSANKVWDRYLGMKNTSLVFINHSPLIVFSQGQPLGHPPVIGSLDNSFFSPDLARSMYMCQAKNWLLQMALAGLINS